MAALAQMLESGTPASLLDVGCGTGTWLRAALNVGIEDVFGVDGKEIPAEKLLIPGNLIAQGDLTQPIDLGRRFDVVLCLEVAEHLDERFAGVLVGNLTRHASFVIFSAACPGQPGQHHVNCKWPDYWQALFNASGFVCSDEIRWHLWSDRRVEPWYRQNMFFARFNPNHAGKEARLKPVIHPDMRPFEAWTELNSTQSQHIEKGGMPTIWYFDMLIHAILGKVRRKFALHAKATVK